MAIELTMQDHAGALVIRATQEYSRLNALVAAFTGGAFVVIAFHARLPLPALAMAAALVAGLCGFSEHGNGTANCE